MANRIVSMLTDRQAKLAKKTIAVGGVKGLVLRVRETGSGLSKHFVMRIAVDGKVVTQTIGEYPQVSLEKARKIALEWREKMLDGFRPREEAIMERRARLREKQAAKLYTVQRCLSIIVILVKIGCGARMKLRGKLSPEATRRSSMVTCETTFQSQYY